MLHATLSLLSQNLWAALLIAIFFGGSIFVHELGHFLAARLTGLHVDRFSIGFGPPIFSWKGKSGVEYRLSWFPLGGYVLLPQLADLSAIEGKSSVEAAKLPPASYGAKMVTFIAGAFFNVLFALALACIVYVAGQPEPKDLATPTIGFIVPSLDIPGGKTVPSPASQAGLQAGDIVRSIDGTPVHDWTDVNNLIKLGAGRSAAGEREVRFVVERDGRTLQLTVHPLLAGGEHYRQVGIGGCETMIVEQVGAHTPAGEAGFQKGDVLYSAAGVRLLHPVAFDQVLEKQVGQVVPVVVQRGSSRVTLPLKAVAASKNLSPIGAAGFETFGPPPQITVHKSPFRQLSTEIVMTVRTVASLVNPHSDVGLSKMTGVIGIVQVYNDVAPEGLIPVMALTILININLAILNLLPVPVLDGGQMLFATIAWVRGRSLPMRFIVATQSIFMMAIMLLMVYIGYFDVLRWRHG